LALQLIVPWWEAVHADVEARPSHYAILNSKIAATMLHGQVFLVIGEAVGMTSLLACEKV
jgi:hypothetical protein